MVRSCALFGASRPTDSHRAPEATRAPRTSSTSPGAGSSGGTRTLATGMTSILVQPAARSSAASNCETATPSAARGASAASSDRAPT